MDWRVKGLVQKSLSLIPGGVKLNTRLQNTLGGMRDFDHNVGVKVSDWATSMSYLSDVGFQVSGSRLMEIGTGWHPALPLCFFLAGAGSIATFDIVRLLDEKVTFHLLDGLEKRLPEIAQASKEPAATVQARFAEMRQARTIEELLRKCSITYRAPGDARATGVEANSFDLVYSNSVLEHVPRESIAQLMKESFRVLVPGGMAMHNVGCNDHYAFFDKSISFINFLKYDERGWRLWNNSLQYQNRMRAPEFVDLATAVGFEVVQARTHVRPGTREALPNLRIAPEFRHFSVDELVATTSDFIVRKPMA